MSRYVLLAAAACTAISVAEEPAHKPESLLPLAVGNQWTYKVSGQEDRFVVRVARQEMVGEQTCFRLDASLRDRVVATEHLAFKEDGLYRFRVDKEDVTPPLCILKHSPPKNGRWRQEYRVGGRMATGGFTVGTGDVNVPLGKFKTVTIEATATEGPSRTRTLVSYADGVGIVKQEVQEGKRTLVLDLEKFDKEGQK
jgi:hypothetical protein